MKMTEERKDGMKKLLAIVGTNSDESTNRQLLNYIKKHFKEEATIELMEIKDLPLFDKPDNYEPTKQIKEMAQKIEQSDGVIIASPEYDQSVPAVLLNALAWLSYKIYPFVDKALMIVGASYGRLGSSRAQNHLRQILNAPELKARTMPSNEFLLGYSLKAFDEEGNLIFPEKVEELEEIFAEFMEFIDIMKQLPVKHRKNLEYTEKYSWEALD